MKKLFVAGSLMLLLMPVLAMAESAVRRHLEDRYEDGGVPQEAG